MNTPKQPSNVAFADALERARQIAAKLGSTSAASDTVDNSPLKRPQPLTGTDPTDDEPSSKKPAAAPTEERQSEIIKRLSDQYGVKVTFIDDPTGASSEKLVRLTGDSDKVARAQQVINQLSSSDISSMQGVFGEYGNRTSDSAVIESQFNVPAEKAGIVIGKGGESIKEINRRSGAYVEIDRAQNQKTPSTPGSFKVFNIRGTKEQIMQAQHMIYDKCSHGGAPNMVPPPGHPALLQTSSQGGNTYPGKSMMQPSLQTNPYQSGMFPNMDMNAAYSPYYGHNPGSNASMGQPMDVYGAPGNMYPQAMQAMPSAYGMQPNMWPGYGGNEPWQQMPTSNSDMMMAGTQGMDPTTSGGSADWAYNNASCGYGGQQRPGEPIQPSGAQSVPDQPNIAPSSVSAPPVTNPQTGQPDYSLAWAEYYRSIGLHAQADYIISHATQNNLIPSSSAANGGQPSNSIPMGSAAPRDNIPSSQQDTLDKCPEQAAHHPGSGWIDQNMQGASPINTGPYQHVPSYSGMAPPTPSGPDNMTPMMMMGMAPHPSQHMPHPNSGHDGLSSGIPPMLMRHQGGNPQIGHPMAHGAPQWNS